MLNLSANVTLTLEPSDNIDPNLISYDDLRRATEWPYIKESQLIQEDYAAATRIRKALDVLASKNHE